jgi:hypothetical protein
MINKNWMHLAVSDFKKGATDWDEDYTASIFVDGKEVVLVILKEVGLTEATARFGITCIDSWYQRLDEIAKRTEAFLTKRFLPGRQILPTELILSDIEIDGRNGTAKRLTYRFTVGGDYSDPTFRLNEFDADSIVELEIPIKNDVLVLEKSKIRATNDFD